MMVLPHKKVSEDNLKQSVLNSQRAFLVFLLVFTGIELTHAQDATELAKAAQNPLASMISLPFQNNTNFDYGPDDKTQNILNIQPVWPFEINDDWLFVSRTILPVVSQPALTPNGSRTDGLGDTTFTGWFVPNKTDTLTWGLGPVVVLPTSTDDELGTGEWGGGVSFVALAMPGNWVVGSLFSNVWDINGDEQVNLFTWQPIINYNLSDGWYLASAPIINANWEADSDNRWTIPVGMGVGKIIRLGKQPVNTSFHVYYNVEKPEVVGDWSTRIQFQLMFPK